MASLKTRPSAPPGALSHSSSPDAHAGPTNDAARLRRLVQAVQDLSRARSLEDVTKVVRSAARDLTGADGATFVLREEGNCHYADEDAIAPLWKGQRFPLESCISGWVMRTGQSVAIPDIYKDDRIPHAAYRPTFVKSLVMVPIRPGDPLGAIGNYWASHHEPSRAEVDLLAALANTAAVALENVKLYQDLESRVQRRTLQLSEANRELEAFAHTVSHDLRAPLRSMGGFVHLLEARHARELSPEAKELLAQVQGGTQKLGRLVESLLEFSSAMRQPQTSRVDARALVQEVAAELVALEEGRPVQVDIAAGLPPCQADPELLRQVWANLLANALKFTRPRLDARVEVGGSVGPEGCTYFVRDNGVGFDMAQAGLLFTPFQTLHRRSEHPGSGIGLSIVRRIVERHGGKAWAEGTPGVGATFWFSLPHAAAAAPSAP